MSQEQVQAVRRMYDAGEEVERVVKHGGDLASHPAMQVFHPGCVLEEPPEIPDGATYHGREGIASFFQVVYGEVWAVWHLAPTQIIEGPEGVFAAVHHSGRSKSGIEVEMELFQVFRFQDDMISHVAAYFDRCEALKAVGLEE